MNKERQGDQHHIVRAVQDSSLVRAYKYNSYIYIYHNLVELCMQCSTGLACQLILGDHRPTSILSMWHSMISPLILDFTPPWFGSMMGKPWSCHLMCESLPQTRTFGMRAGVSSIAQPRQPKHTRPMCSTADTGRDFYKISQDFAFKSFPWCIFRFHCLKFPNECWLMREFK